MIDEFNKYWASVEAGHWDQVCRDYDDTVDMGPIRAGVANRRTLAFDVWGKAWEAGREDMRGQILGPRPKSWSDGLPHIDTLPRSFAAWMAEKNAEERNWHDAPGN